MAQVASERFDMRIRPEVVQRLRAAAELEHMPLAAFLTAAGLERAERVLAERHVWSATEHVFAQLLSALDAPARSNAALAAAAAVADELIERR